ncbi:hypothetical protein E2562_013652 [Oryza meyeriana var. granulata]|uniref:Uncharacterized protein n=1 Tax=Oryza meyeriana var. granulata TaxID=110450 RepID=A0A6G1BJV7_9ORYZ|nr:hypothetical protein E2562_013652 [Oryza meyeriana var. granulata]
MGSDCSGPQSVAVTEERELGGLLTPPLTSQQAGSYRVGYDVELSGAVAPGQVTGIEGVRVLFAWVPITAVEVGSGEVILSLGLLKKSFPAVRFKSSPPCIAGVATTDS